MSEFAAPRFGSFVGPWRLRFAWFPTRRWDGVWLWLQPYRARLVLKHEYLTGGADTWWWNA